MVTFRIIISLIFFFFKQKTAYEMRISDWSSDVCSSDLGIIFVLLGEQLPAILAGAKETVTLTGHSAPWWLGIYVIATVAGLAALRFIWVWVSLKIGRASCRERVCQYV